MRDLLLGLDPHDIDLVTAEDPVSLARNFADAIKGNFFIMSEEFMTCRVISADGLLNYDFSLRRGEHIVEDLRERDFTVNAMAVELPGHGKSAETRGAALLSPGESAEPVGLELIDPFGGAAHLAGHELVPVEDDIFDRDPLRLLRAVRLEKQSAMTIGPELARRILSKSELASKPSAERTFTELSRVLEAPGCGAGARRLDELGLLDVLIPELSALKGITQNEFHHLDVFEHTLAFLDALDNEIANPESFFPGMEKKIRERLERRLAGGISCRLVLGLAGLFHDIAKPYCRFTDTDGLVRFFEHDRLGADMAGEILTRFKASSESRRAVIQLVRRHMRFEGLIQENEPSDRARLRYLRATEPFSQESIMLSVSDRLAVRGIRVSEADIEHHLELARSMMAQAFARDEAVPLPKLTDGEELMKELKLKPGPLLGKILDQIHEEQQLGQIDTRDQALLLARAVLEDEAAPPGSPEDDPASTSGSVEDNPDSASDSPEDDPAAPAVSVYRIRVLPSGRNDKVVEISDLKGNILKYVHSRYHLGNSLEHLAPEQVKQDLANLSAENFTRKYRIGDS